MDDSVDTAQILDCMSDGVYVTDRNRRVTYWNRAAEKITGFSSAETVGNRCADGILMHVTGDGDPICFGSCPLEFTMKDARQRESEVFLHHKLGHRVPVMVRTSQMVNGKGDVIGGVEVFSEIKDREALRIRMSELQRELRLDKLTQLPNRAHLDTRLEEFLCAWHERGEAFGVVMADIDHFKRFNDTYGHDVGDLVLQVVARTLDASLRPFDVIGRWGGEEFLGVFPNVDLSGIHTIAERLRNLVAATLVHTAGEELSVTISVGGTLAREGDAVDEVVKRADESLYASKREGRNRTTIRP